MANLFKWEVGKYTAFMGMIARAFDITDAEAIMRSPSLIKRMLDVVRMARNERSGSECRTPWLDATYARRRLRVMRDTLGWRLSDEAIDGLGDPPVVDPSRFGVFVRVRSDDERADVRMHLKAVAAAYDLWVCPALNDMLVREGFSIAEVLLSSNDRELTCEWGVFDFETNRRDRRSMDEITRSQRQTARIVDAFAFSWFRKDYFRPDEGAKDRPGLLVAAGATMLLGDGGYAIEINGVSHMNGDNALRLGCQETRLPCVHHVVPRVER